MALQIHNSMSRKKEPFQTIEPGVVRMYVCGPTVYDSAHVGHAMSAVVFDIIRRYLEYRGYQVRHIMNYTDVEDKVIRRANELGLEPMKLAHRYIEEYDQLLKDLNILPAVEYPKASEEIDPIIEMIVQLIDKGFAYEIDGDVYFRVDRDEDYGRLSGRQLEEMRSGTRLEVDERKENAADFALWKAAKEGEPAWESPWGPGRPGWHIECSAMSLGYLGEQIDIHGGGNDLLFPHHENEIAQTESLTDKPFASYWVHNGMLKLRGEKMSKSLGNLVTVEAFLQDHEADAFRMMVLRSHYRSPLTFDQESIEQAEKALDRLRSALRPATSGAPGSDEAAAGLRKAQDEVRAGFESSMDDDFNTPGALSQVFDFVRAINQARDAGVDQSRLTEAQETLLELARLLGLRLDETRRQSVEAAPFIDLLVDLRRKLREEKLWELGDMVRTRLADLGVVLEDGKDGTLWRRS